MPAYDYTVEAALRLNQASLRRVQSEIVKGLSNLSGDINVKASAKARQNVDEVVSRLRSVPAAAAKAKLSLADLEEQFKGIGGEVDKAGHKVQQFSHQTALAFRRFAAFTVATSGVSKFVSALDDAVRQAVEFDREMVRLNQVSEESRATIAGTASDVSTLSRNLGVSSAELIRGAVVFKQAGLSINETRQALDALAKSALAPNFDSVADTAEGMIAIMRQFKIPASEMEKTLGSLNAVAGAFAVEASDLITAIKKTGGAFNAAAGDSKNTTLAFNELLAVFTSVRSTTRESAAEIATGLRTIFSRLQRQDTVNALKQLNVNLRYTREELAALGQSPDLEGQFVGAYEAVRRLSEALNTIPETDARFSAIIETLGGVRQISRVIPLIQQQTESQKALNVAQAGTISLSVNAEQAQGALAVQLQKVKEEWLATGRAIADNKGFRSTVDLLGSMATNLATVSQYIGPLLPLITALVGKAAVLNVGVPLFNNNFQNVNNSARRISGVLADSTPKVLGGRGYAGGGKVAGSGVTDNQTIRAMPGEYVIPKEVARSVGYGNLDQEFRTGRQRFSSGGRLSLRDYGQVRGLVDAKNPDHVAKYILPGFRVTEQLTEGEKRGVKRYAGNGFSLINRYLTEGLSSEHRDAYREVYNEDIDEVISRISSGVNKGRLPQGVSLFRGIGRNRRKKLFGVDSVHDIHPGHEITDKGFSSFTANPSVTDDFGSVVLEYVTRKNDTGLFLGTKSLSGSINENEVLHAPGSRFRVVGRNGVNIKLERFANGGSVVNKKNVQAILAEYQKTTGINFGKLVSRVSTSGLDDRGEALGSAKGRYTFVNTEKFTRGRIYLNPKEIQTIDDLRYALAHELGHAVDHYSGSGVRYSPDNPLLSLASSSRGSLAQKFAARNANLQRAYDVDDGLYGLISNKSRNSRYSYRESFAETFHDYLNGGDSLQSKFNRRGFSGLVDKVAVQTGGKPPTSVLKSVGQFLTRAKRGSVAKELPNSVNNVRKLIDEYQATTGIKFAKILSGIRLSEDEFGGSGTAKLKYVSGKKPTLYINPNSVKTPGELRAVLAKSLGHAVDLSLGDGKFASGMDGSVARKYADRQNELQKMYDSGDGTFQSLTLVEAKKRYSRKNSFANTFADYVNGGDTWRSKFGRRGFGSLLDGVAKQTGGEAPSLLKRAKRLFGFERGGQATKILRNDLLKRLGPAFARRGVPGIEADGLVENLLVGNLQGSLGEFNPLASAVIIDPLRIGRAKGDTLPSTLLHEFFHAANHKSGAKRGKEFGSDVVGSKLYEAGEFAEGKDLLRRILPKATFEAYQKHYADAGPNYLTDEALAQATSAHLILNARKNRKRLGGVPKELIDDIAYVASITIPEISSISQQGRPERGDRLHLKRIIRQMEAGKYAAGGVVSGLVPGTGNTDSVPTDLPFGSYVIRKSSVQQLGHAKLAEWAKNPTARFASGGAASASMPALVMPGEWIFTPEQAKRIGTSRLDRANKFGRFATGGEVRRYAGGGSENRGIQFEPLRTTAPLSFRGGEAQLESAKASLVERIKALAPSKSDADAVAEASRLLKSAMDQLSLAIKQEEKAVNGAAKAEQIRKKVAEDVVKNKASRPDFEAARATIMSEPAVIAKTINDKTLAVAAAAANKDPGKQVALNDEVKRLDAEIQSRKTKLSAAETAIKVQETRRADIKRNAGIANSIDASVDNNKLRAEVLRRATLVETIKDAAGNKTFRLPNVEASLTPEGNQFGKEGVQGLALERANEKLRGLKGGATAEQKLIAQDIELTKVKQEYIDAVSSQIRAANKGISLQDASNLAAERFDKIASNNSQTLLTDKNGKIIGDAALGAPASRFQRVRDGFSSLRGYSRTAGVFAAPIAAELLFNPGAAADAVASGSGDQGGFVAKSALGNAAQLGAAGAVINPFVGVAAAAYGFADGVKKARLELTEAKLGVAAQDVADKFRQLAEGLVKLDPTVAASIVGKQGDLAKQIEEKATRQGFSGFLTGPLDTVGEVQKEFWGKAGNPFDVATPARDFFFNKNDGLADKLAIRNKLQREEFGKQLPGIVQTLNVSASELGKNAPARDRGELTKQFLEENDAFAQKQIDIISKIEGVAPKVVQERFVKVIAESQRAQIARDANSTAIQAVNKNINSLELFSDSIRSAISSIGKFSDRIKLADDLFAGIVSGQVFDTAGKIEGGGAFNRKGFTDAVGSVAGVFGEEGNQFTRLASGLADAKLALPTILAQVRSDGGGNKEEDFFPLEVQKRLREALSPKVFDSQLNQILGVVSGTLNNEKPNKLFDESGGDVGKLAERLLEPLSGPFKEAFAKAAKDMDGAAQRFVDGLAQATQRQRQILETLSAADQKQLTADRAKAEVDARRAGKEGLGIDALSLQDLTRPFDRNQAALVKGLGVVDPNNSKEIADALVGIAPKIEEAQKRQDAAQANQFNGDAEQREFREASKAVIDLKSAAAQGQQALKNLADSTDRVSAIQEKLNRVKAKEDAQLGIAERFLVGDASERAKLRRGQEVFNDVQAGRVNVNDLSRNRRQDFVEFARANGPDGNAVLRKALGGVVDRDGKKIVEEATTNERDRLENELVKAYQGQATAATDLARVLTAYSDVSSKALVDSQNELVKQLRINNATLALAFKQSEVDKASERVGKSAGIAKNLDIAKSFGVEDLDRAKLINNNRANIENFRTTRQNINLIKNLGSSEEEIRRNGGTDENVERINVEFLKILNRAGLTVGGDRLNVPNAERDLGAELEKLGFSRDLAVGIAEKTVAKFVAGANNKRDDELTLAEAGRRGQLKVEAARSSIREVGGKTVTDAELPKSEFSKQRDALTQSGLTGFADKSPEELKKLFDALKPLTDANQSFASLRTEATGAADELKRLTGELAALKANLATINPASPRSIDASAGLIGGVAYKANGGIIAAFKPSGTDTVPAMLTPNEFVVNRASAVANRGLLERINNARGPLYLAGGGRVFDEDARYGHFFRPNTVGGFAQQPNNAPAANGVALKAIDRDAAKKVKAVRDKAANEIYRLGRAVYSGKRSRFNDQSSLLNGLGESEILGLGRVGISDQRSIEANVLAAGDAAFSEFTNDRLQGRDEAKLKKLGFRLSDEPIHFAGGGHVPGVGNTDSVFAKLTPGEFVFNKAATAAIGANTLATAQKFATGGLVGGSAGATSLQNQPSADLQDPVNTFGAHVNVFGSHIDRFGAVVQQMGEALKSKIQLEGRQQITVNVTGVQQGQQNDNLVAIVNDAIKDQLRRSLPNLF